MEWQKIPGGTAKEWGGGVRVAVGHLHPRSGRIARGGRNTGVDTKGNGVTGEDGRGWGGDGNPPTTRSSK